MFLVVLVACVLVWLFYAFVRGVCLFARFFLILGPVSGFGVPCPYLYWYLVLQCLLRNLLVTLLAVTEIALAVSVSFFAGNCKPEAVPQECVEFFSVLNGNKI